MAKTAEDEKTTTKMSTQSGVISDKPPLSSVETYATEARKENSYTDRIIMALTTLLQRKGKQVELSETKFRKKRKKSKCRCCIKARHWDLIFFFMFHGATFPFYGLVLVPLYWPALKNIIGVCGASPTPWSNKKKIITCQIYNRFLKYLTAILYDVRF